MTPLLRIVAPGLFTTVQDLGRRGHAAIGLPNSGPLDRVAMRLANALVGNDANAPVLEILVHGPTVEIVAEAVRVAFVGGTGQLAVGPDGLRRVATSRSVRLFAGDALRIGPLAGTACGYLAVEGGFAARQSFGSASTYVKASLGGHDGRPLRVGDVLSGAGSAAETQPELTLANPLPESDRDPIRVVLGPQDDYFTPEAVQAFLSGEYVVSPDADRMGYRLQGPVLSHARGADIISDGIVSGSIQVPGSGQPIVLMRDNQTAGGYPKIATVISADLSVLGRRGPGSPVRFQAVERTEAEAARRRQEQAISAAIADFRPVREEADIDLDALYRSNLIGGAVSALARAD